MKGAATLCIVGLLILGANTHRPACPYKNSKKLIRNENINRLSNNVRPTFYDLVLNLDFDVKDPKITGKVEITIDVDSDLTPNNTLHLHSNVTFPELKAIWNRNNGNDTLITCNIKPISSDDITIECPESIIGKNQSVTLNFIATLQQDDMHGAYLVKYQEEDIQKLMIATQFEEEGARRVFPCFDEPHFKAPIQLTLVSKNFSSAEWMANTESESDIFDSTTGVYTTIFKPTPPMSTYLLAFVATQDFTIHYRTLTPSYTYSIFIRKTAEGYWDTAINAGYQVLNLMNNYLNISYKSLGNSKLSLAAIPEFSAGAMENWGLITFRESLLIDEGEGTTRRDIQSIVSVVAHELTHQWFGDYVTLDWWSETWLNEGFAEYFEYYLTDHILNDTEMSYQLVVKEQQDALKVDAYPNSIPLSNKAENVATKADLSTEFGTISYSKGASIIKLINYLLGDDAFHNALSKYLTAFKYSNPTAVNLTHYLQSSYNGTVNLEIVLNEWINASGYPLVTVTVNENNTISISTRKFSSSLNQTGEDLTSKWWIPLTYTTSDKPNFDNNEVTWIDPELLSSFHTQLPANNESWIIVNLQAHGFYRVDYDDTLWDRIIHVLNTAPQTISVLNRAQLLDDVFNIARSMETTDSKQKDLYLRAFNLANYLKNETEYHPWYTFFVEMQYLLDRIQDEDAITALKSKIKEIISSQVEIPSLSGSTNSSRNIDVLKQNLLLTWACKVGHVECLQWADDQFAVYQNLPSYFDNNFRDVVLCSRFATTKFASNDYEYLVSRLNSSILPLEQNDIAKALSCLPDDDVVSKLFNLTLQDNIQFSRMTFNTIANGLLSQGKSKIIATLKYIAKYYENINKKWKGVGSADQLVVTIGSKSSSKDIIDVLKEEFLSNSSFKDNDTLITAVKAAVGSITENMLWVDKYGETLSSVIIYGDDTTSTSTTTSTEPTPTTTSQSPETTTESGSMRIINSDLLWVTLYVLAIKIFFNYHEIN
ncbi:hypothetical protein ABEB36_006939 [Hypothenemus hampei]|uniref:Aminopeptidase n=1 Tax=Hypothenemus hampei TaxID=57062 RepID=A0ABD1ES97_HYPHA